MPDSLTVRVVSVNRSPGHRFSKEPVPAARLLEGLGVEGDAHAGVTVQHRSRVARDPSQPNLRQVHLLHAELLDALAERGHLVRAGELGENITTLGIDLLALPVDTQLRLGDRAVVTVTGLRNPCAQIESFRSGLLGEVVRRAEDGSIVRLAGIMGVVTAGGIVRAGDPVTVRYPPLPHRPLDRV